MEKDFDELSIDELDNVIGGINYDDAFDEALKNSDSYRKEMLERLEKEKESLLQQEESYKSIGRSR